ncbi:ABC transporter substrate-binding protein [Frankia sp. AgB1.9]|uniref:ABC transporter substrate-binding protein n=1 Tax=unclassified Frankia TaxID=2632575 RepID=UPI0019336258|nr:MULTISPECIES: ABC transporter substrate-binding protein [unclassified Frankia]MBL7494568.1 ABC transporter substrate-binding protein [Frankia sp. AgW1.1]MBL7551640.1 ABC transporter substrate-binding protein [Frankia sp. AgB1.9]MBL7624193.1 ABC transporter substrate-binding protein [Frankia sp. AgB1.8]
MSLRRLRAGTTTAALAALLVVSSTFLVGCGQLSSTGTATAGTCPTPETGVTAKSIKIGLVYPDSGPTGIVSTFSGTRSGVEARIALQNAHGGVNGRTIDLVWRDDQANAPMFSAVAHDLVDTQKIFGLIAQSIVVSDSAAWLSVQNVPVTGAATTADWTRYPNFFDFGNLFNPGAVSTFGDYVQAQGGTKALIVADPTFEVFQNLDAKIAPSLRNAGIAVIGTVSYTGMSPARVAEQLKSSGANALVAAVPTSAVLDIYAAARRLGVKLRVVLGSSIDNSLVAQRGPEMAGLSFLSSFSSTTSPAMVAYSNVMHTYAPQLANPYDELALDGYVAADEMIEGLQLAGACPTRDAFIKSLRQVGAFTGNGLIAPVNLSQPKAPTICVEFLKVDRVGGSLTPVPPPATVDQNGFWCGHTIQ